MVRVAVLGGTPELEECSIRDRRNGARRHQPSGAKLRSWRSAVGHSHGRTARTRIATTIVLIGFIGPHVVTLTAEPYRGSTDQRTVGAEFGRCDDRALRVLQIGHPVDLDLGSSEERVTEPQGDRTGDDGELQIEQIGNRTDGSADEPASPDAFGFVGRFGGTARAGGDAGAADLGLQHALHMGVEFGALGFDHDMTDVAGIPALPSSSRPSRTMPPPTPVDTTMPMKFATPRALPFHASPSASAFVVVDVHGQAGVLSESGTKRKVSPYGDVDR